MDFNSLQKNIIATVSYFDAFDYPLTNVEVWKWLIDLGQQGQIFSLQQIAEELGSPTLAKIIGNENGFYFLIGRQIIINTRLQRYYLAKKKFNVALRATRILRYSPFIKAVFICNNAGYYNSPDSSDIDFFIITTSKRLWLARLITVLVVNSLKLRRHGQKIANRLCLSFFTSEAKLNFDDLKIKPKDIYLTYWLATLAPIYNQLPDDILERNNPWFKKDLPNFYPALLSEPHLIADGYSGQKVKKFIELLTNNYFGNLLESLAKRFQIRRIKRFIGSFQDSENCVVITDDILKLHTTDRRRHYWQLWANEVNSFFNFAP